MPAALLQNALNALVVLCQRARGCGGANAREAVDAEPTTGCEGQRLGRDVRLEVANAGRIPHRDDGVVVARLDRVERREQVRQAFVAIVTDTREALKQLYAEEQDEAVLAREKARALYAKLISTKGTKRQALVKAAKSPAFKTLMPFSMQKPPMTSDGRMLLEVCGKLQVNGISAPQENVNGAVLIYMVKRTLPSNKEFEKFKPMVKNWYTQSKIRAAQYAFSAWVNTKCKQATQD